MKIEQGLKALAEMETRAPSPAIEAMLLREWHRVHARKVWNRVAVAGALAAGLGCVFLLRPHKQEIAEDKRPVQVAIARPAETAPSPPMVPAARHMRRARRPVQPKPNIEAVEFVAVPFAPPLETDERAQLLRVSMPAATLASWGFQMGPVDPDRILNADVVVGENGLARAVRLIR